MAYRRLSIFVAACLAWAVLGQACAAEALVEPAAQTPAEASIPFANRGGIRDWRVEDDSNLLLQDRRGQWYRVRLQAPAYYLAYAGHLAFATGPSGTLERLDAVIVGGQKYPIISLTRIEAPAAKAVKPSK